MTSNTNKTKRVLYLILINCYFLSFSQVEDISDNPKITTENVQEINKSKELVTKYKIKAVEKPLNSKENDSNYLKSKWIELLGLLIAILAFFIPIYRYLSQKREEQKDKRFVTYHELIADLVDAPGGKIDRQIATIFELRNFPSYYELTKRIITDLTKQWSGIEGSDRLITEMSLTLIYINKKARWYNTLAYKVFRIK